MTTSASAASNTESCYPVWWTPAGFTAPVMDWFEKYAVTAVSTTDQTAGGEAQSTQYVYSGGAAWHYDDNEVVKAKYRTYGQFRGYGTVETLTGSGTSTEPQNPPSGRIKGIGPVSAGRSPGTAVNGPAAALRRCVPGGLRTGQRARVLARLVVDVQEGGIR